MHQFTRAANIYFLVRVILQAIPYISPFSPISFLFPFLFVIFFSMTKDCVEDYRKYKNDKRTNSTKTKIFNGREFATDAWENIAVGDIVKVLQDEIVPSDLVLLDARGSMGREGTCFIETSSLDGERNLKQRTCIQSCQELAKSIESLASANISVEVPPSNTKFYELDGKLTIDGKESLSLNKNQFLPRGAVLKNTESVIGIAIYVGHNTKLMKNSIKPKIKVSTLEQNMRTVIGAVIILEISMIICATVAFSMWLKNYNDGYTNFWKYKYNSKLETFFIIFSYFMLLVSMLPLNLMIMIDLMRILQCYFLGEDIDFYSDQRKRGLKVLTTTLNEELGQIEYVFSDKTGTLTNNVMLLKHLVVGNTVFTNESSEETGSFACKRLQDNSSERETNQFLRLLSLCHTCVPEAHISASNKAGDNHLTSNAEPPSKATKKSLQPTFVGASPDEVCLVNAAANLGYVYKGQSSSSIQLSVHEKIQEFTPVATLEFDNDRKMMSVIIKSPEGDYILYSKGADSSILSRLGPDAFSDFGAPNSQEDFENMIEKFSIEGLRVLVMGYRILSVDEVNNFVNETARLSYKTGTEKEAEMKRIFASVEKDLKVMGLSAVEDKLQDRVPETIYNMLRAGIKVWMLTGDKIGTAETIGYACKLINSSFSVVKIEKISTAEEINSSLQALEKAIVSSKLSSKRIGVIIDGKSMESFASEFETNMKLFTLLQKCNSVICCRVTPSQKSFVVKVFRKHLEKRCLAIGDGGNDVNMIQQANVGVGIIGMEGLQAANSADFAVPEFKSLEKLLFVYGRNFYQNASFLICFSFYKTFLYTVYQFYHSIYHGFSAKTAHDSWYMDAFNAFWTFPPILFVGIFDQDWRTRILLPPTGSKPTKILSFPVIEYLSPVLYYRGQQNLDFNGARFVYWLGKGCLHCFLIWILTVNSTTIVLTKSGYSPDFHYMSIVSFTSIMFVANTCLMLRVKTWNLWVILSFTLGSYIIYFLWFPISDQMILMEVSYSQKVIWSSPTAYLTVLMNVAWVFLLEKFEQWYLYFKDGWRRRIELLGNRLQNIDLTPEELELLTLELSDPLTNTTTGTQRPN
jgi:phospholipid-transporting ATPase